MHLYEKVTWKYLHNTVHESDNRADDIFRCIFVNEKFCSLITIAQVCSSGSN